MSTNKPSILILLVLSTLAAAGLYGEFQSGYYTPQRGGSIDQTLSRKSPPDATYAVESYALYPPELPPGEGQQEVEAYCNTCHSVRYITMQPPLPAATWEAEVSKMTKTYGASIPEDATSKIVTYLESHYTPETRKR
ncbi:MAG: hypothetical protein WBC04_07820 [Candidatus Acidiferrales bacterium]